VINEPNQILFYTTPTQEIKIEVYYEEESFWMSQKRMAELFGVGVPAIAKHLKNIFESGELNEFSTISKKEIVQTEGNRSIRREVTFYNLDAIIAVGYRVNSLQATKFRIWATKVLKEFIIKGFVLDDERLKNGKHFGKDYFDELLEKIREICASERRFYQKITDIYKECSSDYDANSPVTKQFFQTVQNKLEFAITGMTAAEIIYSRVDKDKPHMGLQTWKNAPSGKILKGDVTVVNKEEISELNRIVTMYLDLPKIKLREAWLCR